MGQRKKLYVIDGFSYVFRAFYAIRQYLSNSKGQPTNAIYGFLSMLQRVIDQEKPDYLAIALESKEPTVRHQAYAEYKANREEMPEDLAQQLPYIFRIIEAFRVHSQSYPGYEADDVIATLARRAEADSFDVVIVSSDKDLFQLVTPHVRVLDTMKNKLWDEAAVEERYGVAPQRLQDLFGLMGDKVDNVPGVPGVGEKTALALVQQFGDLESLLERADEVERKKVRENLKEFADQARLSKKLVRLESELPFEIVWAKLTLEPFDRDKLVELYRELEFVAHLRKLTESDADPVSARLVRTANDLAALMKELQKTARLGLYLAADGNPITDGKLVGIALASAEGVSGYVPLGHDDEGGQLDAAAALEALAAFLDEDGLDLVCHDVKAAREILHTTGRELRADCFDTMLAAYLLGATRAQVRLEDIAFDFLNERMISAEDVRGAGAKARPFASLPAETVARHAVSAAAALVRLEPLMQTRLEADDVASLYYDVELPLAAVLAEMEEVGVKLDRTLLDELSTQLTTDLEQRIATIYELADGEFKVDSPKQLAGVLFDRLGLKPVKKTKTGYSTDSSVLEQLSLEHPLPSEILNYRQLAKLKSTYVEALPRLINPRTGRIHTSFNQAVAATGRLSSSDPNLQNIPIRTDLGRQLRRAFVAEAGCVLLSADYSQIELRILAHFSGDPILIDAFQRNEDVHQRTASEVFGVAATQVDDEMRRRAKTVNFGIVYGLSPFGLSRSLGIDVGEARTFIDLYFERYSQVKSYLDSIAADAHKHGYVTTLLKRRRYIPDLQSKNRAAKEAAERTAINTPMQGSAADIIKLAMLAIHHRLKRESLQTRMLLQVHDELLFEVPNKERGAVEALVRDEMEQAVELTVPIIVEIGSGPTWFEAH